MGSNKRFIATTLALLLMSSGLVYAQDYKNASTYSQNNLNGYNDTNEAVKVLDVYLSSFKGKSVESAVKELQKYGINYQVEKVYKKEPSAYIVSQYPQSGQYIKSNTMVYLYVEETLTKDKVKWLQESLKIAGFYTAKDGVYGKGTAGKLKEFKSSDPSLPNDSVFDSLTERSLQNVLQEKIAPDFGTTSVLVNKNYYLPSEYAPKKIVKAEVKSFKDIMVSDEIKEPLENMFSDAKKAGHVLYLLSGYRSYDYQEMLFSNKVKSVGFAKAETVVAVPGESEHQTGLAIDISCQSIQYQLNNRLEDTKEYKWLVENCYKYGFILRYPKGKSDITGYIYEPWHYRYIGDVDTAKYIMDNKMTYEEYEAKKSEKKLNN